MTYPVHASPGMAAVMQDVQKKMDLFRIEASRPYAQHESVLQHLSSANAVLDALLKQIKMCEADARYKWLFEANLPSGGSFQLLYPGTDVALNAGGRKAIGTEFVHDSRNYRVVGHRIDAMRERGVNVLRLLETTPAQAAALAAGPGPGVAAALAPTAAEKAVLDPADARDED